MGATHYVSQESALETDPWVLGSSEEISWIQHCNPLCGVYLPFRGHRRFPIHDVPEETADNHRFLLHGQYWYPDTPDCSPLSSQCQIQDMVRGQHVEPVKVNCHEWDGTPKVPPFIVTRLFNDVFERPICDWPSCGPGGLTYYCNAPGGLVRPVIGRWVIPILRVVGWPGWWLKFHVTGHVPIDTKEADEHGIFRLLVDWVHTNSWYTNPIDINLRADPPYSLWGWDPGADHSWCHTQSVNFDLWLQVPFCDTILCAWQAHWQDAQEPWFHQPVSNTIQSSAESRLNFGEPRLYCEYEG